MTTKRAGNRLSRVAILVTTGLTLCVAGGSLATAQQPGTVPSSSATNVERGEGRAGVKTQTTQPPTPATSNPAKASTQTTTQTELLAGEAGFRKQIDELREALSTATADIDAVTSKIGDVTGQLRACSVQLDALSQQENWRAKNEKGPTTITDPDPGEASWYFWPVAAAAAAAGLVGIIGIIIGRSLSRPATTGGSHRLGGAPRSQVKERQREFVGVLRPDLLSLFAGSLQQSLEAVPAPAWRDEWTPMAKCLLQGIGDNSLSNEVATETALFLADFWIPLAASFDQDPESWNWTRQQIENVCPSGWQVMFPPNPEIGSPLTQSAELLDHVVGTGNSIRAVLCPCRRICDSRGREICRRGAVVLAKA